MAVKVGFVGTGGMAGAHMKTLNGFEDVEFVAMCDVVEEKAKARANEFGGKPCNDTCGLLALYSSTQASEISLDSDKEQNKLASNISSLYVRLNRSIYRF